MSENIGRKNQRWHPRIAWDSVIKFRLHESNAGWEGSKMHDISLGGCYFDTHVPYEPGEVLELEISSRLLKGSVRFIAAIKRRIINESDEEKKFAIAVSFMEMVEDQENSFLETLQSLMKQAAHN